MFKIEKLPLALRNELKDKKALFVYKTKIRRNLKGLSLFIFGIFWTGINLFFISVVLLPLIKNGVTDFTFNGHLVTADWRHLKALLFPLLIPLGFLTMGLAMLRRAFLYFIKDDIFFIATPDAILFYYKDKIENFPWDSFDNVKQIYSPWKKGIMLRFKQQKELKPHKSKDKKAELWLPNPPNLSRIFKIIEEKVSGK